MAIGLWCETPRKVAGQSAPEEYRLNSHTCLPSGRHQQPIANSQRDSLSHRPLLRHPIHAAFISSTPTANSHEGLPQLHNDCSSTPSSPCSVPSLHQTKTRKHAGNYVARVLSAPGPSIGNHPRGTCNDAPRLAAHLDPGRGRRARRLPRVQLGLSNRPSTSPKGSDGN